MRVLFVAAIVPYPPRSGHAQRTLNILKGVAAHHDVWFVGYRKSPDDVENARGLREFCREVHVVEAPDDRSRVRLALGLGRSLFMRRPYTARKYATRTVRRLIRDLARRVQARLFHCDMTDLAELRDLVPEAASVLANQNVESDLMAQRARRSTNPLQRWYLRRESRKLRAFESRHLPRYGRCIVVSEPDRQGYLRHCPGATIEVVANGVDTQYFMPNSVSSSDTTLAFLGGLDWYPNADAIQYLLRDIWPLLKADDSSLRLELIGNAACPSPLRRLLEEHRGTVRLHGRVEDVRPIVGRARAFVVPLRIGGGTRLKILEALAMGKAVVSTTIGAEGLEVQDGTHLLLADTPQAFAARIREVMSAPELRARLGANGRRLVEERYAWPVLVQKVLRLYDESVAAHAEKTLRESACL